MCVCMYVCMYVYITFFLCRLPTCRIRARCFYDCKNKNHFASLTLPTPSPTVLINVGMYINISIYAYIFAYI